MINTTNIDNTSRIVPKETRAVLKTLAKKSFCTLATVSPAGRSHSAGVIYDWVDGSLWVHLERTSRKARNIAASGDAGVCVPFRRLPVGPPFTIHFQAEAELFDMDAPEVLTLLDAGALSTISGHGALDMPQGCFLRLTPRRTVHTFGLGVKIIDLIRDPIGSGSRSYELDGSAHERINTAVAA